MRRHRTGSPASGTSGSEEVGSWVGVASHSRSRLGSANLSFPVPAQVSWRPPLTFTGTGHDGGLETSFAARLAQVDCGSAPVRYEVIVLWVRVSVTSGGSRRWAVMSLQALAGTLARKGREDPEGRKRKFSLLSTLGNRTGFESKVVWYQHFTILM